MITNDTMNAIKEKLSDSVGFFTDLDILDDLESIRAGINALYAIWAADPETIVPAEEASSVFDYVYEHLSADTNNVINKIRERLKGSENTDQI